MSRAVSKFVDAFEARAHEVYGRKRLVFQACNNMSAAA